MHVCDKSGDKTKCGGCATCLICVVTIFTKVKLIQLLFYIAASDFSDSTPV